MYLYSVIPLTKIPRPQPQIVSYFSAENLSRGQLVTIPLGRRSVNGIVVKKFDAESQKQAIRSSAYALKKITRALSIRAVLPPHLIQEIVEVSQHYYEPLGLVLSRALPSTFEKPTRPFLKELNSITISPLKKGAGTRTLVVGDAKNPYFKKKIAAKNILTVARDQSDQFKNENTPFFSANLTQVTRRTLWLDALTGKITRIAGTRGAIFLPILTPATLAIDGENNTALVSWDQHPKIDARTVALMRSSYEGFDVLMRDTLPSINTWHDARSQKWNIHSERQTLAPLSLIDMRAELARKNTSLLSPQLVKLLGETKPTDKVFLFMHRRGFASAIVCRDCGFVVRCTTCELALVQHGNKLLCHHCGTLTNAPHVCASCGGSRLKQLGGGTELIEREVRRLAPHLKVARMDSDSVTSKEEQQKIFEQFQNGDIQVLVGTQMALRDWELPKMRWAGIVMMDGIANLPFYAAAESAFGVLWRLRLLAQEKVVAQTYIPELPLFTMAQQDSFEPFFENQLALRKILGWPPFVSITQLVFTHRDAKVAEKEATLLRHKLDEQLNFLTPPAGTAILGPSPAMGKRAPGTYRWYILIKWPRSIDGTIIDLEKRNRLLSVVSSKWDITVDPIDIP